MLARSIRLRVLMAPIWPAGKQKCAERCTWRNTANGKRAMNESQVTGRVGISGTIVYRDADGNVIKEVPFQGSANLDAEKEENGNDCERVQESGA